MEKQDYSEENIDHYAPHLGKNNNIYKNDINFDVLCASSQRKTRKAING